MSAEANTKERPWQSLTPDEKLERRIAGCLSAEGIKFTVGAGTDRYSKPENINAMIKCAKEYGVYS